MPIVLIALVLEAALLLVLPPHYGFVHVQQYYLYHRQGGVSFTLAYCSVFVLQLLSACLLRRSPLSLVAATLSLALAVGTFNPTRMSVPFLDWLLATLFLWRSPDTLLASMAERLPLFASLVLVVVSIHMLRRRGRTRAAL